MEDLISRDERYGMYYEINGEDTGHVGIAVRVSLKMPIKDMDVALDLVKKATEEVKEVVIVSQQEYNAMVEAAETKEEARQVKASIKYIKKTAAPTKSEQAALAKNKKKKHITRAAYIAKVCKNVRKAKIGSSEHSSKWYELLGRLMSPTPSLG